MLNKLLVTLATSAIVAGAAAAAPAHASSTQESIFQDDKALIFSTNAKRMRTLDEIKSLGATTIHVSVFWNGIAPAHNKVRKPRFSAANPNAYPPGAWTAYDLLVSEAQARGLQILMTPTQAPAWGGRCGVWWVRNHCDPSPREYQLFVEALGKRYPSVHRWSFWNEPNQARALQPQQVVRHGRVIPWAAVMYRNLLRAGIAGLRASGHGGDQMLLGETAPLGQRTHALSTRSNTPVSFYQAVFCLDSRGRPLRGRVATDEHCGGRYARLPITGVAHHPYTRAGGRAPTWRPGSGEITLANIGLLSRVIAQGVRRHRIPGGLPFYFTEYGFQSNPPDRNVGVSLSTQARWMNQADWLAYRNARVRSVAQYELFDDPKVSDFQTGLRFKNGVAKPSLSAYRLPIWVTRTRSGVLVWGQARPADGTPQTVEIQNGFRSFRTVRTVLTNRAGYLNVRLGRYAGPYWRLAWTSPRGKRYLSRKAAVG